MPLLANLTSITVQEGLLWSTRYGSDKYTGSLFGRFRVQFAISNYDESIITLDVASPAAYTLGGVKVRANLCVTVSIVLACVCTDTRPTQSFTVTRMTTQLCIAQY